ncbi:hypothetical protein ILUMI_25035 [Ignelater luminosus]|uniref:BED-type domain-containing protein n=1 Tax=Ignelater luminosus TaxID=2038154 RepID=A0A8K0C638_IGNLU|nr:hypothetical protein ILUMI_25035 [Ignelater luminosus]
MLYRGGILQRNDVRIPIQFPKLLELVIEDVTGSSIQANVAKASNTSCKHQLVEESIGPSQIPSSSSTRRKEDKTEDREKKKFKVLRQYDHDYLKYSFIQEPRTELDPQLTRHLVTKHSDLANKPKKILLWRTLLIDKDLQMFPNLDEYMKEKDVNRQMITDLVQQHLQSLKESFEYYYPKEEDPRNENIEIWTYFTLCDAERAKCKLCNNEYSRKGRTTTAMRNHLKAMHKTEFSELKKCANRKHDASKTLELASSSHQSTKSDMKQISLQEFDNSISEIVALEDLPFCFVESVGFVRLMKHLCPSCNLKSRQYFTSFICDKLYGKVSQKILELLKSFEKLSFTSDIWSDNCSGISLLSLTCHGITEEFERKMIVLKAEVFNESRHTGKNIAYKLEDILSLWEIPKEKVKRVVRNAGANMKKGVNLLNVKHIDCASHKIQNVLKEGMKAQETVVAAITKCKKMATHFHHSATAQDELANIQKRLNQKPLKIIQECATRWNSTFYMLERILQVKESLCLYASTNNKIPQLTTEEWMVIEKLIGLLRPFEEVTKELSAADVSISSVIPLIATLEKIVNDLDSSDEHIGDTITVLKEELIRKFSGLENEILFATATFIDPRYQVKFFKECVIQHILDLLGDSQIHIV